MMGAARMISDFDSKVSFKYWWETNKWYGSFQLHWLFVKDVGEIKLRHIKEYFDYLQHYLEMEFPFVN